VILQPLLLILQRLRESFPLRTRSCRSNRVYECSHHKSCRTWEPLMTSTALNGNSNHSGQSCTFHVRFWFRVTHFPSDGTRETPSSIQRTKDNNSLEQNGYLVQETWPYYFSCLSLFPLISSSHSTLIICSLIQFLLTFIFSASGKFEQFARYIVGQTEFHWNEK